MSLKSFLTMFKTDTSSIINRLGEIKEELIEAQASINRVISMDQAFIKDDSKQHYNRLVESAINGFGVAMWGKDTQGRFLFVNKVGLETMLKCTLEEAVGHKPEELEKNAISEVCMKSEELVMNSKTTKRFIECGQQLDEDFICLDTIKSPVYRGQEVLGTIGSGVIITSLLSQDKQHGSRFVEIGMDEVLTKERIKELLEREEPQESKPIEQAAGKGRLTLQRVLDIVVF